MRKQRKIQDHDLASLVPEDPLQRAIWLMGNENPRAIIVFPKSLTPSRSFDFGAFFRLGFDDVTYAFMVQVQRLLDGKDRHLEVPTIISICRMGARSFLLFLAGQRVKWKRSILLSDIDRQLILRYIAELRGHMQSPTHAQRTYGTLRTLLLTLGSRGLINTADLFPDNPFPRARSLPAEPYSETERRQIAQALKVAIQPIHRKDMKSPTCMLLVHCLFALALRTGRNVSSLIEMEIDCLRPHFKDGMRLLVLPKRRSNKHVAMPVKVREPEESVVGVMTDTIALIERVVEVTANFRADAPEGLEKRLWIYRSRASSDLGEVTCLAPAQLLRGARALASNHGLTSDEGGVLRVNVARMRKTFANRVFELSRGDLHATAIALGNSPKVTDDHYLRPSEHAEANWRLMGEILTSDLAAARPLSEKTPVGRCRDSLNGEFAPRNGAHCTSFLKCTRCRSYVVTGDDLYRLYSFYWRLVRERERIGSRLWEREYAGITRTIDRDVADRGVERGIFTKRQVATARELAKRNPHPYWTEYSALEDGL